MGTSWKTLLPSDYFKKGDVKEPLLLTVKAVFEEPNPFEQGEQHWVMSFHETRTPDGRPVKKLQMKPALYANMEGITGNEEIESWVGARVVLYIDPNVLYMGRREGGVRLRAPRARPQQAPPPPPVQQPTYEEWPGPDDDIPFSFLLPWLLPLLLLGGFMA